MHPSERGLATSARRDMAVVVQVQDSAHGGFGAHGCGEQQITLAHLHGLRDLAGKADTPAWPARARRLANLIEGDPVHSGKIVAMPSDAVPDWKRRW